MGAILTQLRDFPGAAAALGLFLNASLPDTPVADKLEAKLAFWKKCGLIEDIALVQLSLLQN